MGSAPAAIAGTPAQRITAMLAALDAWPAEPTGARRPGAAVAPPSPAPVVDAMVEAHEERTAAVPPVPVLGDAFAGDIPAAAEWDEAWHRFFDTALEPVTAGPVDILRR
jgi:hypothetical protein